MVKRRMMVQRRKPEILSHQLTVNFSEDQNHYIRSTATELGITFGEVVRMAIDRARIREIEEEEAADEPIEVAEKSAIPDV